MAGGKEEGILRVSVVSLLRYSAIAIVLLLLTVLILATVANAGVLAAATFFYKLQLLLFFGMAVYGISYMVQDNINTRTVFGKITIVPLLRYAAIAVAVIGFVGFILGLVSSIRISALAVSTMVFNEVLFTVMGAVILYAFSYIIARKRESLRKSGMRQLLTYDTEAEVMRSMEIIPMVNDAEYPSVTGMDF